jgi:hypothetical protein
MKLKSDERDVRVRRVSIEGRIRNRETSKENGRNFYSSI